MAIVHAMRNPISGTGLPVVPAIVAAIALAAPAGSLAASTVPPCTKQALKAGLKRGYDPFPQGELVRPWGCAGQYAYAGVIVQGNELTILFREVRDVWSTASRAKYCTNGSVPSRIRVPACNTN